MSLSLAHLAAAAISTSTRGQSTRGTGVERRKLDASSVGTHASTSGRSRATGSAASGSFDARLCTVLHAASTTPFFRNHFAPGWYRQAPRDVLAQLPVLQRDELRSDWTRFLGKDAERVPTVVVATSGTAGQPSQLVKPKSASAVRSSVERRWYASFGLSGRVAVAIANPWNGIGRKTRLTRDRLVVYTEVGLDQLDQRRLAGSRRLLIGAPDILAWLAVEGMILGCNVASSFELLDEGIREKVTNSGPRGFGEIYSAREVSAPVALAYAGCQGMHVNTECFVLEILRRGEYPQPLGEAGRVVITDLLNIAMPLVRYEIGDIGHLAPASACSCDRSEPLLVLHGRVFNRVNASAPDEAVLQAVERGDIATTRPWVLVKRSAKRYLLIAAREPSTTASTATKAGATVTVLACDSERTPLLTSGEEMVVASSREPLDTFAGSDSDSPGRWVQHPGRQWRSGRPIEHLWSFIAKGEVTIAERLASPVSRTSRREGATGACHQSLRSGARRLLARSRAGSTTRITILDTGSMAPLAAGRADAVVRWSDLPDRSVVGRVVAVEGSGEVLVLHRACGYVTCAVSGDHSVLQIADSYRIGDPYSGYFVSEQNVLGVVEMLLTDRDGAIDLTSRSAAVTSQVIAAAGRILWAADRSRLRLIVVWPAFALQRLST